jgi:hypothetical protein
MGSDKMNLNKLEKTELINLLTELSKLNKENKIFIETRLNSNFDELFNLSCKKIDKALSCYETMSLKDARSTLIDFNKAKPSDSLFIDLCIYYIKSAYEIEKTSWKFQENFYSAIEKTYNMIFELLEKDETLKEKYTPEIKKLINKANEGWGHKDYLKDKFNLIKNKQITEAQEKILENKGLIEETTTGHKLTEAKKAKM